ncbi:MAG: toxin Bro, partial [Selenomonadaceae bacterium]|nr:toxin Bro [Selenomonadaceae bacterium]
MKDNALINFNNADFGNVRAMLIDGEAWFVGKDVAEALGYEAPRNAIKKHVDAEDKLTHQISASGQNRNMTLINESGMYALVFGSQLDSAKKFKRWVTHDVLPSIRKTGSYSVQDDPRWLQTRQNTKLSHKPFTDAINLLIEYLNSR